MAAPSESVEDPDVWEAHLAIGDGFVARSEEEVRAIIALWPDTEAIEREHGETVPQQIVVTRRSAKPKPQSEGSAFRRLPAAWTMADMITLVDDFDSMASAGQALMMYEAAIGVANHQNALDA